MSLSIEDVLLCPNMPSLPTVALEVLELARDPDVRLQTVTDTIEKDPALAAKILKTVNSSYYCLAKPCPTILRALTYLGLSTVKSLVLGFSLVDLTNHCHEAFDHEHFWRHSLYSAVASRRIAEGVQNVDEYEAFTATLLQDIGMLAMQACVPGQYARLVGSVEGDYRSLPTRERAAFGFDHAQVAAAFAQKWNLPGTFLSALTEHHDGAEPANHVDFVRVVALATLLVNAINLPSSDSGALAEAYAKADEWFKLQRGDVDDLVGKVASDAEQLARLFGVVMASAPDIQRVLSEAEELAIEHRAEQAKHIEQLERQNATLSHQIAFDPLSAVGSRERFEERMATHFRDASIFRGALGLILIDVDHFNAINDEHGQAAGDVVLTEIARRLGEVVRDGDDVCRYGGEEFAVILPGAPVQPCTEVAERLRDSIGSEPIEVGDQRLNITVSLGIATYTATDDSFATAEALTMAAERALTAAKEAGRDCVRLCRATAA